MSKLDENKNEAVYEIVITFDKLDTRKLIHFVVLYCLHKLSIFCECINKKTSICDRISKSNIDISFLKEAKQ